jgi:hypothetical protein
MGRDFRFRLIFFAKPVESLVWYNDSGLFRVNGGEGEVLSLLAVSGRSRVSSYGRISKVTFGDSLEECGFSNVCKTNLKIISVSLRPTAEQHTIPLFKLLPGLPSKSFSSFAAFLGGIFFLA